MSTTLKLVAYNTSFANDAHWSQLHPGLSESAAIVAKAVEIYKNTKTSETEPATFDELNDYFMDNFVPSITETDVYKNEDFKTKVKKSMQQKLGYVRMQLADAATSYLKSQMESSAFIALIEQMIHVPENHQAFYGGPLVKSNLDVVPSGGYKYFVPYNGDVPVSNPPKEDGFEGKNTYFGILRRIRQLKLYDIDGDGYAQNGNKGGNIIVYDNVVNVDSAKIGGAAEGIAIVVNKDICSGEQLFVWAKSSHPNKILGNSTGFLNDIGSEESPKFLHYYSDDFGQVIFKYRDESNPNRVRLVRQLDGIADLGRPIILTAGIKEETLHIFVAIHSVNIFNMAYLDDTFYGTDETLSEEKRKTVNSLTKIGNLKEDEESNNLKTKIYQIIHRQIGQFITDALQKTSSDIDGKFTKVQLYLGGDFNDPEGEILKLLKTGLSFSIKGTVYDIKFSFDYDRNLLFSCCANRDSQTNKKDPSKKDKDQIDQTVGPLENAFNRVFGKNKIGNKDKPVDPIPYDPQDFYKFEKFGYNGDYALFGTLEPSPNFRIELDKSESAFYKYEPGNMVMASDHLPVYAIVTPPTPQVGGRRRRYSIRSKPKRYTKKTLPKNPRASRRNKRNSRTHKKH